MNWSKEALFSKSKLFMEKAFLEDKDSPFFGILSAVGLELLARAAIAHVHPVLLAESDNAQKNALYALGLSECAGPPKSIAAKQVINLCGILIPGFDVDLQKLAIAMTEVRNEELHSGGAAFKDYNQDHWIGGFYKACQVLAESMEESLVSLFGMARAREAISLVYEEDANRKKAVKDRISALKRAYEEEKRSNKKRIDSLIASSEREALVLRHQGYFIVDCPCCGNKSWIEGRESFKSHEEIQENNVTVRKDVIPDSFQCSVCGLRLSSYAELKAAELPLHYTNTYTYDPVEYFSIDVGEVLRSNYYDEAPFD